MFKCDAMVAVAVMLLVEPFLSASAVRCGSWSYSGRYCCITFCSVCSRMVSGSLGLMVSGNNQYLGLTTGQQMAVCSLLGWLLKRLQWYRVLLDEVV